jgi:hypothetical protein
VVVVERVAGVDREDGVDMQVLRPLEELEQAEPVGGLVVPRTAVGGAVHQRTNGVLPVEALIDLLTLKIVASGKAEELRMHLRHLLHEVRPVAVLAVLVGGGEERDQIEPELAGVVSRVPVVRVKGYCFHSFESAGRVAEATVLPLMSLMRETAMGPMEGESALA